MFQELEWNRSTAVKTNVNFTSLLCEGFDMEESQSDRAAWCQFSYINRQGNFYQTRRHLVLSSLIMKKHISTLE